MYNDTPLNPDEFRVAAEGLAAIAIASFEMGEGEGAARSAVLSMWQQLGRPSQVFAAAADSIAKLPQPLLESAPETERSRQVREMLGVLSSEESLTAMLNARDLLQRLSATND